MCQDRYITNTRLRTWQILGAFEQEIIPVLSLDAQVKDLIQRQTLPLTGLT